MTKTTNPIDELFANWEHEVTGTPKHWKKTPEREAIDNKYRQDLYAVILDVIGEDENEAEPDRRYDDPENHPPLQNQEAYMNNRLRAEQRAKAAALFDIERVTK